MFECESGFPKSGRRFKKNDFPIGESGFEIRSHLFLSFAQNRKRRSKRKLSQTLEMIPPPLDEPANPFQLLLKTVQIRLEDNSLPRTCLKINKEDFRFDRIFRHFRQLRIELAIRLDLEKPFRISIAQILIMCRKWKIRRFDFADQNSVFGLYNLICPALKF